MQAKRGFTLVEILIVVVILGILAAIVIPQFTQASTEAKTNSLCSNLQTLRSQIELYKVQHNDQVPTSAADFITRMTQTTKIDGTPSGSKQRNKGAGYIYGPYLERIPENPFNGESSIVEWGTGTDAKGWEYNAATGEIRAATADHKTY
ncbi:MAG: prepilin-type N-terminal cleavage/methylation domain-containing protein [Phycisphaerae bacterium]|nr:prepilin-type N-terminal cleavage/methylation domain-containing protein [Phycisphaerae bacterium]